MIIKSIDFTKENYEYDVKIKKAFCKFYESEILQAPFSFS